MKPLVVRKIIFSMLALVATHASAELLSFDSLAHNDYFHPFVIIEESGFRVTGDCGQRGACLGVWGQHEVRQSDPNGAAVFTNYTDTIVELRRTDNRIFDFGSVDLADVFNSGTSDTIKFTFIHESGIESIRSVTTDWIIGQQTFIFNEREISSVKWVTTSGTDHWNQFDNIQTSIVAISVPEPSTLLLAASAIGLLMAHSHPPLNPKSKRMAFEA